MGANIQNFLYKGKKMAKKSPIKETFLGNLSFMEEILCFYSTSLQSIKPRLSLSNTKARQMVCLWLAV